MGGPYKRGRNKKNELFSARFVDVMKRTYFPEARRQNKAKKEEEEKGKKQQGVKRVSEKHRGGIKPVKR